MSSHRISRRDTVPHSGNNRLRSASPIKRRYLLEIDGSVNVKPKHDNIRPNVVSRGHSADRFLSQSTLGGDKNHIPPNQNGTGESKCLSRQDLFDSPAMIRSRSTDRRRTPTMREVQQDSGQFDILAARSRDTGLIEIATSVDIRATKVPYKNNKCKQKGEHNRKHGKARKRKDRQREVRHASKPPSVCDLLEEQYPSITSHAADNCNNNANSLGEDTDEVGKSRRLSLIKRLWNKLICYMDPGSIQPMTAENPNPRSKFLEFLTLRQNAHTEESGMSEHTACNITNNRVVNKEIDDLMQEYLGNMDTLEKESIVEEFHALMELWGENEFSIDNNAGNDEEINRQTEDVMETYYSTQSIKADQLSSTVEYRLNKAKLELKMIRDMSGCIDDIIYGNERGRGEEEISKSETSPMENSITNGIVQYETSDKSVSNEQICNHEKTEPCESDISTVSIDEGVVTISPTILDVMKLSEERRMLKEKIHRLRLEEEQIQVQKSVSATNDVDKNRVKQDKQSVSGMVIKPKAVNDKVITHHEESNTYKHTSLDTSGSGGNERRSVEKEPVVFVIDMADDGTTPTKQKERRPDKSSKTCTKHSNGTENIQEPSHALVSEKQKETKKPVAFVIDIADEKDSVNQSNQSKQPLIDTNHQTQPDQYNYVEVESSNLDTSMEDACNQEVKAIKKPVAFVIDLSDGEEQNIPAKGGKSVSARQRKSKAFDRQIFENGEPEQTHQSFETSQYTKRAAVAFDIDVNSGNGDTRKYMYHTQPEKRRAGVQRIQRTKASTQFPEFENGATLDQPKPTFKMILESRQQLKAMYNKHKTAGKKVASYRGPKPIKANYDRIESKIKTRFTDRDNAMVYNPTLFNGRNRPVENYDGVTSKIQTRFPYRQDVFVSDVEYDEAANNRIKSHKHNYDDIKSKIKTRFPERNHAVFNDTVNDRCPDNRIKPIKPDYDKVKCRIKTRFPSRGSTKAPIKPTVSCEKNGDVFTVEYEKFEQLRRESSLPLNEMPTTYQRSLAKRASRLPLSKNMMRRKEPYRLKPDITSSNGNKTGSRRSSSKTSKTKFAIRSDSALDYKRQIDNTLTDEQSMNSSRGKSLTYLTERKSKQSMSLLIAENQQFGNQQFEEPDRSGFSPHTVLPPISHREQITKPTSPGNRLSRQLSPLRHTPTPPLVNQSKRAQQYTHAAMDGQNGDGISALSPGLNQKKLPPISRTPTPTSPTMHGQSVSDKLALSQSPELHQTQLPPLRRTPTPITSPSYVDRCSPSDLQEGFQTKCQLARSPTPRHA